MNSYIDRESDKTNCKSWEFESVGEALVGPL